MDVLVLLEKDDFISKIIKDSIPYASIKKFFSINEFFENYSKVAPSYVVLDESFDDFNLLDFCRIIREKYSLLLPVLVVLNFHSNIDIDKIKSLGMDYLIKPFNRDELIDKIEARLRPSKFLLQLKDSEMIEKPQEFYGDLIEKIKPIIKEEVTLQISDFLKKFLAILEKKNA